MVESIPALERTEYFLRVALPVDHEVYHPRCSKRNSRAKDNKCIGIKPWRS